MLMKEYRICMPLSVEEVGITAVFRRVSLILCIVRIVSGGLTGVCLSHGHLVKPYGHNITNTNPKVPYPNFRLTKRSPSSNCL